MDKESDGLGGVEVLSSSWGRVRRVVMSGQFQNLMGVLVILYLMSTVVGIAIGKVSGFSNQQTSLERRTTMLCGKLSRSSLTLSTLHF
ncbi:hypothetical protein DSO57_1013120 [Entomophthora muscae]|uniref:Uncharacterized protein n=1 Tax=Entomophthora muscae TaxID=34485 RepID=A0ACC2U496_9FUNG|nr:hypothetical protein DSO57_1013120 [Entomophthora muscae]